MNNPLKQIVASPKVCDDLVKLGVRPIAFLWHVRDNHPENKVNAKGDPLFVWYVEQNSEFFEYCEAEVIPAFTMEELIVMLGGSFPKPDLLPTYKVNAKIDDKAKKTYLDYQFVLTTLTNGRYWPRGAQSVADLLCEALKSSRMSVKEVNDRYDHFFKHQD